MSTNSFDFYFLLHAMVALRTLEQTSNYEDEHFAKASKIFLTVLGLVEQQPYWFELIAQTHDKQTSPGSFDRLMQKLLHSSSNDLRYQLACFLSRRALERGEIDKIREYFPHLLVNDRPRPAQDENTEIKDVSHYDNEIHREGARRLCYFALLDDWRNLPLQQISILDIGCGTGLNSDFLIKHAAFLAGLDINLSSLRGAGRAKRYDELYEGDAQATICKITHPIDLIIATGSIYFFRELDWLFQSAGRLLTPNGQLVFNTVAAPNEGGIFATRSGNHRYCHSLSYLNEKSAQHGLHLQQMQWTTFYGLPGWFLRFKRTLSDG